MAVVSLLEAADSSRSSRVSSSTNLGPSSGSSTASTEPELAHRQRIQAPEPVSRIRKVPKSKHRNVIEWMGAEQKLDIRECKLRGEWMLASAPDL